MGRSFESVRQGVKRIADHWARSSRALKKEDQQYGEKLVELVKRHSSEAFIACDDPLEAAVKMGNSEGKIKVIVACIIDGRLAKALDEDLIITTGLPGWINRPNIGPVATTT